MMDSRCNGVAAWLTPAGVRATGGVLMMAMLLIYGIAPAVAAADVDPAVEAGREALDRWWDYGWYDDDQDDLRPVNVPAPAQPAGRSNFNSGFGELFQVLGWMAVAAILVGIAYLLARAYLQRETASALNPRGTDGKRPAQQLLDRVEALPAEARRETNDLLGAAHRQLRDENYSEAIIYLFSHLLVLFDQHDLLRLATGKTNRQYLREVRRSSRDQPVIVSAFGEVRHAFEDVYYGQHSLSRNRFESCWAKLPQINAQLARFEQERAA